jgi:4-alpha-glucanotransferase
VAGSRLPVFDRRRAGVLLPLSALETPLGSGGRAFIDWLAAAGFSVWQILPVGPAGSDGSPYWVSSDHAGNPAFIDAAQVPDAPDALRPSAGEFLAASASWLPDYALFAALTQAHAGAPFWQWPPPLRDRDPLALARARLELAPDCARIEHEQYLFHVQWQRLRSYARSRGVRLFGDLPFYVAPSSAEVWTHRQLFQLTATGAPAAVAGVPPDYFSVTGQLWGNPLYDWQAMERADFRWWLARVSAQLRRFDLLRLDHFRALSAHWAVPATAPDARAGSWRSTPGEALLKRLAQRFRDLPLVAEDLGVITPDVVALKQEFRLPGMRVLQFAFDGDPANPHLPKLHARECVVYTGTHDNDTVLGWYTGLDHDTARRVAAQLGVGEHPDAVPGALLNAALGSRALLAILPAQDLLGLGSAARLNTPSTTHGNWSWRVPAGALTAELARHYASLNSTFGRG